MEKIKKKVFTLLLLYRDISISISISISTYAVTLQTTEALNIVVIVTDLRVTTPSTWIRAVVT